MKTLNKIEKKIKIEDFIKKNPRLIALRRLPPEVIAKAIITKMYEEDKKNNVKNKPEDKA